MANPLIIPVLLTGCAFALFAPLSTAQAQGCSGNECNVHVTVRVTGSPCVPADIDVRPETVPAGKTYKNIKWMFRNTPSTVKFPDTDAVTFKSSPEPGVFGPLQKDNDRLVKLDNHPLNDMQDHRYRYNITVMVNGRACTKDPTIANSGTHGPPPTKGPPKPKNP